MHADLAAGDGPVLGIWAHPDDEAFLAGGALTAAARAGRPVTCAYASSGEHGCSDHPLPAGELGRHRRSELAAALAALGVADHHCLDQPDGALAATPLDVGIAWVQALLDDVEPACVVTFGPDGFTGHPDHITIHRWVSTALARRDSAPTLWQAAVPPAWITRFAPALAEFDAFWPGYPLAAPAGELTGGELDAEALDAKIAALRAHDSQTAHLFTAYGEPFVRAMVADEWFTQPVTTDATPAPQRAAGPDAAALAH